MHNIKGNFDKIFQTIKSLQIKDFDVDGNVKKVGRKPQFSDLELISLNLVAEYLSIDSENFLFKKINESLRMIFLTLLTALNLTKERSVYITT